MVTTAKPPRKRRQEARKAAIACPAVVSARKPGPRLHGSLTGAKSADDPEAAPKARAWLAKQLRLPDA